MLDKEAMESVDRIEYNLSQLTQIDLPLKHIFTPGLYTRTIYMPAGTMLTSKIHKLQHPFVISQGRASVWDQHEGVKLLEAPHVGVTMPGTRRVLYIHEACVWSTFHVTEETDLAKIEDHVIFKRVNPLLKGKAECIP